MTYVVFSQEPRGRPSFEKLASSASRFFSATLELVESSEDAIVIKLVVARPVVHGEFRVSSRATTKDDLASAHDAEARGRAGGMGALAEKCGQIWILEALSSEKPSEAAYLTLAGICASVALGPVLPPDGATLFGVRGAIERRDKLLP